jgi:hypothetical protein
MRIMRLHGTTTRRHYSETPAFRRTLFESETRALCRRDATRRAECAISFIRPPIVQGGVQLKRYY